LGYRLSLVALGLFVAACPGQKPQPAAPKGPESRAPVSAPVAWQLSKSGLGFRLSDAEPAPPPRPKLGRSKPLAPADTARLLSRVPAFENAAATKPFALREKSLPPPRPGETIATPFPPPPLPAGASPSVASSAPSLVRWTPEGYVAVAPNLSLTFSEPMVAVTSHGDLAGAPSPVLLRPTPSGAFRWVGTQTLLFEPEGEGFPKATEYQVEVPASTKSAAGRALAQPKSFKFFLPAPKAEWVIPDGRATTKLEPVMFAAFDQRVDPAALLRHIAIEPQDGKGAPVGVRLATDEEIEGDELVRAAHANAVPGRSITFKPTAPLPKGTKLSVTLKRGLPSAEGPLVTQSDQRFPFETYGALKLNSVRCGWGDGCPPLTAWFGSFSNGIDEAAFDPSLVTVEPPLPGMKVSVHGDFITIEGRSKGRTKYKVRFGAALRDRFGQTLAAAAEGFVTVDRAEPTLFPEERAMVVLDPAFEPALSVYSVNRPALNVRLYAVGPEHHARYETFLLSYDSDGRVTQPPGRLVVNETIRPEQRPDELVETRIPLGRALVDGKVGQVIVVVEPPAQKPTANRWAYNREWVRTWVQATKLGLQAFREPAELHGWVTRLADGAPVAGAEFGTLKAGEPLPKQPSLAKSAADGMARLALGSGGSSVYARQGSDVAFLAMGDNDAFRVEPLSDRLLWFVIDDRKLYKPGERVHVKGWLRIAAAGKKGDVAPLPPGTHTLAWRANDAFVNKLAEGSLAVDSDGEFTFAFDVPKNAELGPAQLRLELKGNAGDEQRAHSHMIQIQEFRRPEFEVVAETTEGPHFVGGHAIATMRATYYAGGALPDSNVTWNVTANDAHFSPPNRSGYHFGKEFEFFRFFHFPDESRQGKSSWQARTTTTGEHRLRIDFDALEPAYPRSIELEASVRDVNMQSWTARSSLLVHPANITVGLRLDNGLPSAGQNLGLEAIVTDLEGKAVAGRPVAVRCARVETTWRGKKVERTERDPVTCDLTSAAESVRCACATKEGGRHEITAVVSDVHGRKSTTRLVVWVMGGDIARDQGVRRGEVDVVPDKKTYRGGEEARLLLMAPFAPAEGVITLERDGIVGTKRFRLEQRVGVVPVRLDQAWLPGVIASVHLVGAAVRENEDGDPDPALPRRPAFANGQATLELPPDERALALAIAPKPAVQVPGGTTVISVDVKDAAGRALSGARVALAVADEAVLALAGYKMPNPLEVFYEQRASNVGAFETQELVVLGKPDTSRMRVESEKKAEEREGLRRGEGLVAREGRAEIKFKGGGARPMPSAAPAPGVKMMGNLAILSEVMLEPTTPIVMRQNFAPLAAFVPKLVTDARGHAEARVKLPDNLTRYRVMVVASANQNQFGSAESDVTARLPLMVRPSAPRFLNFGDRAELPVVIQNQTEHPMTVDVALRVQNLRLFDPNGQRVVVPAADRVELRFPIAAALPGTARARIAANGGDERERHSDAAEIELPVWSPATTEAFATYGVVDQGAVAQPVKMPTRVVKEFGGLDITTSSTALQGLSDSVLYLVRYPFECNEQIASRVLAIAALRDVLSAFSAEGLPKPEVLEKTVALDVQKLSDRQSWGGGWDYWKKDRSPDPFVSVHVTHALVRAKSKGYRVPDNLLKSALEYLTSIRQHFPVHYPPPVRRSIEAYALDVRRRAGKPDPARARALVREAGGVEKLPLEALGWLLPLFAKDPGSAAELQATRRHLDNRVTETAGKANFVTSYDDGAHLLLHSDRRADGILLDAFFDDRPTSDVIPKLVAGLLADRKRGRWNNTQDNVFVLLGLDRYFQAVEKATPDFVARAWLGNAFAGEHAYRGRTSDRQEVSIPLASLAGMPQPSAVTLSKEGTGRLYFRIGMRYAPDDFKPPPAEHGFSVARRYEGAENADDVKREANGTWRVRSGALVRVRVTMVAPSRRYHVALVDPLPAGFEALNSALAVTNTIPRDQDAKGSRGAPWWWSRAWYEHENLRDERVEAFASLLWDGVYDYTYVARATTPGDFVVPPPKAEEMYDPETFGRGAADRVVVY
jgi:uncharacterized protein YfaS (alpha-2-macroglobulin family)